MKKKFSTKWKSSKQRRKQRKYLANAPLHIKKKMMNANLLKELRKKYEKRSFPLKKGDTVKVFRGKFKKHQGKITKINLKKQKIEISGIQIKKQDGSKVNVWLNPSNVQIIELSLEDKKRDSSLKRKGERKKNIKDDETSKENKKINKGDKKNAS